jgi:hypothetical protein
MTMVRDDAYWPQLVDVLAELVRQVREPTVDRESQSLP